MFEKSVLRKLLAQVRHNHHSPCSTQVPGSDHCPHFSQRWTGTDRRFSKAIFIQIRTAYRLRLPLEEALGLVLARVSVRASPGPSAP